MIEDAAIRTAQSFMSASNSLVSSLSDIGSDMAASLQAAMGLANIQNANDWISGLGLDRFGIDFQIDTTSVATISKSLKEAQEWLASIWGSGGAQFGIDDTQFQEIWTIATNGVIGLQNQLAAYNKLIDDNKKSTSGVSSSINNLNSGISNLNNEVTNLDLTFANAFKSVVNVRKTIAGNLKSFGMTMSQEGYERQLQLLRNQLPVGWGDGVANPEDIEIYEQIRQTRVDMFNAEIEQIRTAGQERLNQLQQEQGYFQSIQQYVKDLYLSDLSPLLQPEKTIEASSNFEELLKIARGEGPEAMAALAQLQSAAQAYLENARIQFGSGAEYTEIFREVTEALNEFGNQVDYTAYENEQLKIDRQIAEVQEEARDVLLGLDSHLEKIGDTFSNEFKVYADELKGLSSGQQEEISLLKQEIELLKSLINNQNDSLVDQTEALIDVVELVEKPKRMPPKGRVA